MEYFRTITLKNGKQCILRNATEYDGKGVINVFFKTHAETDYLLSYVEECGRSVEDEARYLKIKRDSRQDVELIAVVDDEIVGTAGVQSIGMQEKVKHRAEFGVAVLKDFWHLGIGRGLIESCIECAKKAKFIQLELSAVGENTRALSLYRKMGFTEFGKNPKGFYSRMSGYQSIVSMYLEL